MIELADTGRNPEVEEVLGALSLLLNGGGVAQLKTIASELNLALEGREDSAKSVFRQIRTLMGQLDEGKADIVAAIEGLNRLSVSLNDQIGTIDAALEELPSALETLDQQREDLVRMLQAVNRLGDVGVGVIKASKAATIDSFRQLVPVLNQLADAGDAYVDAFHVFLTYPFVDEVVGRDPQVARNLHMGDYTNLSIELEVKVEGGGPGGTGLPTDLPTDIIDPTEVVERRAQVPPVRRHHEQGLPEGPRQPHEAHPAAGGVRQEEEPRQGRLQAAERPPRPADALRAPADRSTRSPAILGDGLGALAPRAGVGWDADYGADGPTMGELADVYDPALVALLVPGMVTR